MNLLLVGKPNSGKSLLFHRLTGKEVKVANYSGATVATSSAIWKDHQVYDLPGAYSLDPGSEEQKLAVKTLQRSLEEKQGSTTIVCVLDATRLDGSLRLALPVAELARSYGVPVVFGLNFMDDIKANGMSLEAKKLSEVLATPVVELSAKKAWGFEELNERINEVQVRGTAYPTSSKEIRALVKEHGPKGDVLLTRTNSWDRWLLTSYFSFPIFFLVMAALFQSIFTWATPLMDATEGVIQSLSAYSTASMDEGWLKDFVVEALFGGIASFLVFAPQIFVLTFVVSLLESSGYLARVVLLCHRPLKWFGLSGKSFIPFLSGHACAIPAIYAARIIESPTQRWLTWATVPLMSCSARLPVYALLIAAVIPKESLLGGLFGWRGMTFLLLFLLGYVVALVVSGLLSKWMYKGRQGAPFVVELPQYRLPYLPLTLKKSWNSTKSFVTEAGPIIFCVVVGVWFLSRFPLEASGLDESYLGQLSKWMEPVLAPMGLDWKYGVAILTSFLAREVFVGVLATLLGIEGDEVTQGLIEQVQASGISLASGLALLVFYVIALQCVSTLAVLKKEMGSWKAPLSLFIFYTVLAYVLGLLTYQFICLLG